MYADVNGTKLYYTMEGTGIPCMIISYAGTLFYERTFSKELQKYFQLIYVDLRGGGQSDPGIIGEITLASLVEDVEQLRQTLNLNKIAVIGHSGNSWLALEYARQYPRNISHLILVGQGPKSGTEDTVKEQQNYWETFSSGERKTILERNLQQLTEDEQFDTFSTSESFIKMYVAWAPRLWCDAQFDCSHLWKEVNLNADVLRRFLDIVMKDYDSTSFLSEITCPVFLALGKYDFLNPPILWDGEKEKFPDCTYHLFERSGHNPQLEEQTLFTSKIIAWIMK
ncbi:unnamed protein product [marine sediment metagenome]|uniref:AB hydrolase-1 domain-containing protein n=1 Tax=marine sediment metagenome TaxID=412755 RepID=X0SK00_9ZZZZ